MPKTNRYMKCQACGHAWLGDSKCPACGAIGLVSKSEQGEITKKVMDEPDLIKAVR